MSPNPIRPTLALAAAALAVALAAGCSQNPGAHACSGASCSSSADCGGLQCVSGCCTAAAACASDADCGSGQHCNAGSCGAASGGGATCSSNADCANAAGTPVCDLVNSQTCVECVKSSDCAGGKTCTGNKCVAGSTGGGCGSDNDCSNPDLPRCNSATHQCVECLGASDCELGEVCTNFACASANGGTTGCTADSACHDPTPYCVTSSGQCVACVQDAQCDQGQTCHNNACTGGSTSGCTSNAQCSGATPKCNTSSGQCVGCLANGDCGSGQTCQNGACTGGSTGSGFTVTTIANAIANAATLTSVEVDHATVVDAYSYTSGTATIGTFYIQDGSGPGLAVYHSKTDTDAFPAVGDIVTVKGHLGHYNGSLQISSSTTAAVTLSITTTGHNGVVPNPVTGLKTADYAPGASSTHDDQVGHVLQFSGPLTVTNSKAIVSTAADGGTTPQGFEVTGGLIVDDNLVYHDCIKTLDGGVGALDLSHGVRGVWDRYQDHGAGSSAPTVPVLYPMSCGDLSP